MALSVQVNFKGINIPSAYVTATLPSISLDKTHISFGAWYRNSADDEVFNSVTYEAPYDLEGDNPFKQAYEHLKSLPEFEGGIDC